MRYIDDYTYTHRSYSLVFVVLKNFCMKIIGAQTYFSKLQTHSGSDHFKCRAIILSEANPVSGVFQNIDPPPPHRTASVCVPPRLLCEGRTHSLGGEGVGVNILEEARHFSVLYISDGQTP